jgi:hypothetical protein
MEPTPAMAKLRKVAAANEVRQNRDGARRKRTSPKATSKKAPAKQVPHKWSSKAMENQEVAYENPAVKTSKAALVSNNIAITAKQIWKMMMRMSQREKYVNIILHKHKN